MAAPAKVGNGMSLARTLPAKSRGAFILGIVHYRVYLVRFLAILCSLAVQGRAVTYYLTIAGLGHEPAYEQRFVGLANELDKLLKNSGGDFKVYTLAGAQATRQSLIQTFQEIERQSKPDDDFVLILIGHGSFDGFEYKFNLLGPDISAAELASLCNAVHSQRQLIVNTTSASGGSIAALQRPGRAIITATKSGTEKNATVMARYWVEALRDPQADTNKNDIISALEAFQYAQAKTAAFYDAQKRLATEHAVFEDTGKREPVRETTTGSDEGLLMSGFALVRLGAIQRASNDPAKRALLAQREELERQIDTLRYRKPLMQEEEYKRELTQALVELAKIQEEIEK
jgi:hypothetical protein